MNSFEEAIHILKEIPGIMPKTNYMVQSNKEATWLTSEYINLEKISKLFMKILKHQCKLYTIIGI